MDIDAILLAAKGPKGDNGDPTLSADLASTDPGKGAELVSRGSVTVASFAGIADVPAEVGQRGISINLASYHPNLNKGGGRFFWDATSTDSDDGGAIVTPSGHSGPGRWVRQLDGYLTPEIFGAKGDNVEDDGAALMAAIGYSALTGQLITREGDAAYAFSGRLRLSPGTAIDFGTSKTSPSLRPLSNDGGIELVPGSHLRASIVNTRSAYSGVLLEINDTHSPDTFGRGRRQCTFDVFLVGGNRPGTVGLKISSSSNGVAWIKGSADIDGTDYGVVLESSGSGYINENDFDLRVYDSKEYFRGTVLGGEIASNRINLVLQTGTNNRSGSGMTFDGRNNFFYVKVWDWLVSKIDPSYPGVPVTFTEDSGGNHVVGSCPRAVGFAVPSVMDLSPQSRRNHILLDDIRINALSERSVLGPINTNKVMVGDADNRLAYADKRMDITVGGGTPPDAVNLSRLFDDTSTPCRVSSCTSYSVTIDLGVVVAASNWYYIGIVFNTINRPDRVRVERSEDGVGWTTVAEAGYRGEQVPARVDRCDGNSLGNVRYIRVSIEADTPKTVDAQRVVMGTINVEGATLPGAYLRNHNPSMTGGVYLRLPDGSVAQTTTVTLPQFSDIATIPASTGLQGVSINLASYHPNLNKGGGQFYWDNTSTDADDGGTIVTPSGHSGPGRWVRRINGRIDLTWFGARGTIADDASDAMEAAIKRARTFVGASPVNNGGLRIYAPKGEYRFTRPVFSYNPEQSLWGAMIYEGDGPFSTYFLLDPQTANDEWFYNSAPLALGGDGRSFYTLHFTGVGFASTGTNRQYANGFLYYSTGFEKNFSFDNCSFGFGGDGSTERPLKILMYACGTGNADQVVWTNCKIRRVTDCVLQLNNNQSIGFDFVGVQCIGYESDLIRILTAGEDPDYGPGGGGMVRWIGGAINQRQTDTGYDRYLVNIVGGGGTLNTTLYFHPDQLEFSNENGRIFKKGGTLGYVKCEFKGAKFDAIDADANDYVVAEIGQGAELIFSECVIRENMIFDITNPAGSQASPEPGALIFQNCTIPEDLSKRITFGGNPYAPWDSTASTGFVEAVRCNIKNAQILVTKYTNSSNGCGDFTMGNQVAQSHGRGNRQKIGTLKRNSGNSWPIDAANALSFIMPYNSTIIGFRIYKPAYASADTGNYQLSVGSADHLITYAQSQLALWKDAHIIDVMLPVEDWIFVGTDENLRKVDLWPNVEEGVTGQTYAAGGVPVVAQVIYI